MDAQIHAAKQARRRIEQVRKQLLSPAPDALQTCANPLMEAIRCMESLQSGLADTKGTGAGSAAVLRNEIMQLRAELSAVQGLLDSAARFYEGYGRLLCLDSRPEIDYSALRRRGRPPAAGFFVHG